MKLTSFLKRHVFTAALISAAMWGVCAHAQAPQVAITFDDLPAHGPLPPHEPRPAVEKSIIATLHAEKMPPIYGFVNGFRLVDYPYQIEILRSWRNAGEPLGNHTWSHPELDKLPAAAYEENIAQDEPILKRVDPGGDWHWFRYPFLEEGNTVAKRDHVRNWLQAHGYRIAEVSLDFQDYQWNDTYARCSDKHNEAAIAHLHDTYLAAASQAVVAFRQLSHTLYGHDIRYVLLMHIGAFDARMLPELIAQFRAEGFQFISLPEAMSDPAYSFDPHQPTPGGSTFMEQVAGARHVNVPELPDYSAELDKMCK